MTIILQKKKSLGWKVLAFPPKSIDFASSDFCSDCLDHSIKGKNFQKWRGG